MKKRRIIKIILIIIIVFSLHILVIVPWDSVFLRWEIMKECKDDYKESLTLEYVSVYEDKKEIAIAFEYEYSILGDEAIIATVYDKVFNVVYNQNNKYQNYNMDILFHKSNRGNYINIFDITFDKKSIRVANSAGYKVSDIANICPEVANITFDKLEYDSIEEFDKFINLKSIYCHRDIVDINEKEYIQSLFPDCEISWDGK